MGCLIAGIALRRIASGEHNATGVEGCAGAQVPVGSGPVQGKPNGNQEVAARGDHAVWNVVGSQVVLIGLNQSVHLAVCADADTIDVKLVTSLDVLSLDREVACLRVDVDMDAIPRVGNIAYAVGGQRPVGGDGLPAAVVVGGRGEGGVVVRGKEPLGAERHAGSQVKGVEVARIAPAGRLCRRGNGNEDGADEKDSKSE